MNHGVRYESLDLLRTVAIALVFTEHFNIFAGDEWFRSVGQFGWIGVDLFFVLSGYLIASQLLKALALRGVISLKEFYIRRGLRIWPSFLAVLLVYLVVPAFTERSRLPPIWRFLTFTQNFALDFKAEGAFSHAWSLCVEEQFYIVLPFLLLILYRRSTLLWSSAAMAFLIGGGVILRYLVWQKYVSPFYHDGPLQGIGVPFFREIYYPTYCRLDGLAVGVSIAAIQRLTPLLWEKIQRHSHFVLASGLVSIAAALACVVPQYSLAHATLSFPLVSLGFGCLVIAGLSPLNILSRLKVPGMKWGATLAFSFYLTHKQMIHLARQWLVAGHVAPTSPLFPVAIFLVCLVAAGVLYLLVERPFLNLRDRMLSESDGGLSR